MFLKLKVAIGPFFFTSKLEMIVFGIFEFFMEWKAVLREYCFVLKRNRVKKGQFAELIVCSEKFMMPDCSTSSTN